jgi:sugar phosphate isomerase/epimerase
MGVQKGKAITVTCYKQNNARPDWKVDLSDARFEFFFVELAEELARFSIRLEVAANHEQVIDINSYADLLNSVRIASPTDGFTSLCIGHIIGKSPNLDLMEDIKRAINRVAFAPETIAPEDHNRQICHNCGCGC